jgi:hypothetical protein
VAAELPQLLPVRLELAVALLTRKMQLDLLQLAVALLTRRTPPE